MKGINGVRAPDWWNGQRSCCGAWYHDLHHCSWIANHWIEEIGEKHSECPQDSSWSTIRWLLPGERREITPQINRLARTVLSGHGWKYSLLQNPHEHIALVHYGNYMYNVHVPHCFRRQLWEDRNRTTLQSLSHVVNTDELTTTSLKHQGYIVYTLCHDAIIVMDDQGFTFLMHVALLISQISLQRNNQQIMISHCEYPYTPMSRWQWQMSSGILQRDIPTTRGEDSGYMYALFHTASCTYVWLYSVTALFVTRYSSIYRWLNPYTCTDAVGVGNIVYCCSHHSTSYTYSVLC